MRSKLRWLVLGASACLCLWTARAYAQPASSAPDAVEYLSPVRDAKLVLPGTTIAVRPGAPLDVGSVTASAFTVSGSQSGMHTGRVSVSDDQRTIIFAPAQAFSAGESVQVSVAPQIRFADGQTFAGTSFAFSIRAVSAPVVSNALVEALSADSPHTPGSASPDTPQFAQPRPRYLTVPENFMNYSVTVPADGVGAGNLFIAPFLFQQTGQFPYLLMLDSSGELVYYKQMGLNTELTDFKRQPSGMLSYYESDENGFVVMDEHYNQVDTYRTGNGYQTDLHDLQILPNGHALMLASDPEIVNTTIITTAGYPTATVIGMIVQELDLAKNVVFQWRSWDHFNITDTYESLASPNVDPVHSNAVALDQDGNLLISSRNMSEVTKINRQTGDILWRMGGKQNQFTFVNNPQGIAYQHDIRRLPNGHITLWDNRNGLAPLYSEAEEYQLDEVNKIATMVWSYRNSPDSFAGAMGSAQRLPEGNTLTGWGTNSVSAVVEAKPDGTKAFELEYDAPYFSYRALRFPWQGAPLTKPTLVAQATSLTTTLAYSWNGATDIASYKIYGGATPYPTALLATQARTGFENQTIFANNLRYCYFRVMPVDNQGNDTQYSNEVYLSRSCLANSLFLPQLMR